MADISNKFLVFLLVIAILVSIIGTWYSIDKVGRLASLTGYQTTGYVNVTIESKTEINVTQPYCGFGSGYVTEGFDFAVLTPGNGACTVGPDTKANWTNQSVYDPECMEVQNLGNTRVEINVSSAKNAAEFLGGTSPSYKAWSEEIMFGDCASGLVAYPGTDMDKSNKTMCANLSKEPGHDEIRVGCYLKIPKDAVAEAKTDTWTFTGTAVA